MINLPQIVKDRKKLFLSLSVVLVLLLPAIWFGLGHVIAKQALTVPHGCGLWESNTPTNWAETPSDAKRALDFGAEGIGLFRIEHMFYGEGSEDPLFHLQEMIMANSQEERKTAMHMLLF